MFSEFMKDYCVSICFVLSMLVFSCVIVSIKKEIVRYIRTEEKKTIAKEVVQYIEEAYEISDDSSKINYALDTARDIFDRYGLLFDRYEMRIFIESVFFEIKK